MRREWNSLKWRYPIPVTACPKWLLERLMMAGPDVTVHISGTIKAVLLSDSACAIGCTLRKPDAAILGNVGIDLSTNSHGKPESR